MPNTTSTNVAELQAAVNAARGMLDQALSAGLIDQATYNTRLAQITPASEQGTDVTLTVRVSGDVSRLRNLDAGTAGHQVQLALAATASRLGLTVQNVTVRV